MLLQMVKLLTGRFNATTAHELHKRILDLIDILSEENDSKANIRYMCVIIYEIIYIYDKFSDTGNSHYNLKRLHQI